MVIVRKFQTRVARVADLLNRYRVHYVVVGAEACNVHGLVRSTKDVDLLLEKTQENAERALEALGHLPYQLAREIFPEEILKKPFTIIGDDPRVDLLFCAGKLKYEDAIKNVCRIAIEGIEIPFANVEDLIQSKQTDRAKDKADLEVLTKIKSSKKITDK